MRSLIFIALLLGLASSAMAKALPPGVSAGPSLGGISEYRLENGLRVLLSPDPSKPRMLVNITYLVGSKHENYGETGMAHLLEHLLFKGTPSFTDIPAEFAKRGMSFNGTTWADRTNYYEVFAASDDALNWALELEASRMVDSFVARKDLDSEMTVVRNEMEMGETNPFRVSLKQLLAQAFMWHNYGNDTIGARSDVENVNIERLQAFYRTYYQPDNAVLLIAGPIDPMQTLAKVAASFGKIPKATRSLPVLYTAEPDQDGEREATIRRVAGSPLVLVGYHTPGAASAETIALNVAGMILGDSETGRLRAQVVDAGLAASTGQFALGFQERALALFILQLNKTQDIALARAAALKQIEGVAAQPFTDEEFARAKTRYRNQLKSRLDDVADLGVTMSEYIALGDWRTFFLEAQMLERLKLEDVNQAAGRYLIASNRNLVNYLAGEAPQRAQIPAPPDVAQLLKTLEAETPSADTAAFVATPLEIEKRTERTTTASGIRLALLEKATRNDAVNFVLKLGLGDEKSLTGQAAAADAMSALLYAGTKRLTRVALNDMTESLESEVQASTSVEGVRVAGRSTSKHFDALLGLLAEALKQPRFDAQEFETWRAQRLSQLEQAKLNPAARAGEELALLTNPYRPDHPLAATSNAQQQAAVKALQLDQVKAFHKRFFGAQWMQMAVVGGIDKQAISQRVEALFGDWRAPEPYVRMVEKESVRRPGIHRADTPEQANAMLMGTLPLALNDQAKDYPALLIGAYILGGGALDNRLLKRLRQKEGFSYGGAAFLQAPITTDQAASMLLFAQAAPENVDPAYLAVLEELALLNDKGISTEELKNAQSGWLASRRISFSDDPTIANSMASQLEIERTFAFSDQLEKSVAALNVDAVNSAMVRWLQPSDWTWVIAADPKKTSAAATGEKK